MLVKTWVFILVIVASMICASSARAQFIGHATIVVTKVEFIGGPAIKESNLQSVITTKETPGIISKFFHSITESWGAPQVTLESIDINNDTVRIRELYNDRGYNFAHVGAEIVIDTQQLEATVRFIIDQGKPLWVKQYSCQGVENIDTLLKKDIIPNSLFSKGTQFTQKTIFDEIRRVITLLGNNGYPFAKKDSIEVRRKDEDSVTVLISFLPGKKYTMGDASIVYDTTKKGRVDDDVVHTQLNWKKGDFYSAQMLSESQRNLLKLNTFQQALVEYDTGRVKENDSVLPIKVFLAMRDVNEIFPEVNVTTGSHFALNFATTYTNRNLFSRAYSQQIGGSVELLPFPPGRRWSTSTQFTAPQFFSPRIPLTLGVSYQQERDYISRVILLEVFRAKASTIFEVEQTTVFLPEISLEPTTFADRSITGTLDTIKQFNTIFSLTFQRDKSNDIFNPFYGSIITISSEASGGSWFGPGSAQYAKFTATWRDYTKLVQSNDEEASSIGALKFRIGFTKRFDDDSSHAIPLDRRFFAGGANSVRGWQARSLSLDPSNEAGTLDNNGSFLLEGSIEVRQKLFFVEKGTFINDQLDKMWGGVFLDAGQLWGEEVQPKNISFNQIALAVGFGVRYTMVFGVFRLDLGLRLFDPNEIEGRKWLFQRGLRNEIIAQGIQLGIGQAF